MINFKPGCTIIAHARAWRRWRSGQRSADTADGRKGVRRGVLVCSADTGRAREPCGPVPAGHRPNAHDPGGRRSAQRRHPTPPVPVRCGVPAAVHVSKFTHSILVLSSVIRHTVIRRKFLCAISDRCRLAYNVSTQTRAPKPDYCTRRSMRAIGHTRYRMWSVLYPHTRAPRTYLGPHTAI